MRAGRLLLSATLQDHLERTDAREGRLHEIHTHKDRKENPILRHIVSQSDAQKHHDTSKETYDMFVTHDDKYIIK